MAVVERLDRGDGPRVALPQALGVAPTKGPEGVALGPRAAVEELVEARPVVADRLPELGLDRLDLGGKRKWRGTLTSSFFRVFRATENSVARKTVSTLLRELDER